MSTDARIAGHMFEQGINTYAKMRTESSIARNSQAMGFCVLLRAWNFCGLLWTFAADTLAVIRTFVDVCGLSWGIVDFCGCTMTSGYTAFFPYIV